MMMNGRKFMTGLGIGMVAGGALCMMMAPKAKRNDGKRMVSRALKGMEKLFLIFRKKGLLFPDGCAILNERHGYAPLAQLDRVSGYGPEGQGFESLTACQNNPIAIRRSDFLFFT